MQITMDNDKNVRNGLFGTALNDEDVKFNVNLRCDGRTTGDSNRETDAWCY